MEINREYGIPLHYIHSRYSFRSVKMSFAASHYCFQPNRAVYFKEPPKVARVEPQAEPEVARPENIVCPAGDTVKVQRDVTVEQLKREVEDLRVEVSAAFGQECL